METEKINHTNTSTFYFADFKNARNQLLNALRNEPGYFLLTGESGSGKTTLLHDLQEQLDRSRYRILYLSHASLSPLGLTRILAARLHLQPHCAQAETAQIIAQALNENTGHTLLWLDEAHYLNDDTLNQIRTLAEAHLGQKPLFSVLLTGLPQLRIKLASPALFPLWRRIHLRLEISGLLADELQPFLKHLFGKEAQRFPAESLPFLFERGRGLPGLIAPLAKITLQNTPVNKTLDTQQIQNALDNWELP